MSEHVCLWCVAADPDRADLDHGVRDDAGFHGPDCKGRARRASAAFWGAFPRRRGQTFGRPAIRAVAVRNAA